VVLARQRWGGVARQAQGLGERIRDAIKTGAIFGGVSGAGNAEGGPVERIKSGAEGALIGAALAPALSEVAAPAATWLFKAAQNAPQTVPAAIRSVVPGTRVNIDERLMTALERQGMTPADLRAQMAADQQAATFGNTTLDVPLTLADSGPAMRDLAYQVKAQPGVARTEAQTFLEGRQRGLDGQSSQYDRMADATRRSLRVTRDNAARMEDSVTAGRDAAANAAYDAYRAHPGTIPVEDVLQAHAAEVAHAAPTESEIAAIVDKAHGLFTTEGHAVGTTQLPSRTETARFNIAQMRLGEQIDKAATAGNEPLARELANLRDAQASEFAGRTRAVNLTGPRTDLNPAQFDVAKQQLDDMIGVARRAGDNYKARVLLDLKSRLVARADEVTAIRDASGAPVLDKQGRPQSLYRAARESYSSPSQVLDALEAGRGVLKADPDRVAQPYSAVNTPAGRAYRTGAAGALVERMGGARSGNNVAAQLDTPNVQTALRGVAGPGGQAKLNAYADLETRMFQTRQRVQGGSPTNENQNLTQDFTLATRLGRQLKEGNVFAAAGDLIASTIQRVYRFREQDARLLARDLFATDPARREATVRRLENVYGQRVARNAVSTALQEGRRALSHAAVAPVVNHLAGRQDSRVPVNSLLHGSRY
jgi:hypothetical protein